MENLHIQMRIRIIELKVISFVGLFLCLGCSGFVPSIHLIIAHGFFKGVQQGALGWLLLMGALYIIGALLYAFRVPERFFPGKCNIWVSESNSLSFSFKETELSQ